MIVCCFLLSCRVVEHHTPLNLPEARQRASKASAPVDFAETVGSLLDHSNRVPLPRLVLPLLCFGDKVAEDLSVGW